MNEIQNHDWFRAIDADTKKVILVAQWEHRDNAKEWARQYSDRKGIRIVLQQTQWVQILDTAEPPK